MAAKPRRRRQLTQAQLDARAVQEASADLRQVPSQDVKELHWWRQNFATRFAPGSLPRPGTALVGRRLVLLERVGHQLASLDRQVVVPEPEQVDVARADVRAARADSQRSLQLAAQARRQVTSAADFAEMLMNRLAEIAEQLPAHDQVGPEVVQEPVRPGTVCARRGCDNPPVFPGDLCTVHGE